MSGRQGPSLRELRAKAKSQRSNKAAAELQELQIEDIYEKASSSKLLKKLSTGIIYDDRFMSHKCMWDQNYPENPERYKSIIERCNQYGLLKRCKRIESKEASINEISPMHDEKLINILLKTSNLSYSELEVLASDYDAIYFNENTSMTAYLAAGCVINMVKAVVEKQVQNGMAIVRPPGHHAMNKLFCGYCYFNNVAIAARYALHELKLKKILIVDWDVHHGQGTQQMFYDDNRVLYFSIHRYEHGKFWPNLRESNFDYVGVKQGTNYNFNFPLNETGCTNIDFINIFTSVLMPIAYEFGPDLILISAGYDSAIGDDKGEMKVSPGCYHLMTTLLMGLANGKVVAVLEGGYFLPSLSEGAAQTLRALLGDPTPILELSDKPKLSVKETIYNLISTQQNEWHSFQHISTHYEETKQDSRQTHNVVAQYLGREGKPPYETRDCYPTHSSKEFKYYCEEMERLRNCYYDNHPVNNVGFVYDDIMLKHASSDTTNNFETPERLTRTMEILSEMSILDRLTKIDSKKATDEELNLIHMEDYIKTITKMEKKNEKETQKMYGWTTVYTNEYTNDSSRTAVGSLIELTKMILSGKNSSGLALIRPPGHHAEHNTAMGFCIFNNVSIAAKYALTKGLQRVLIIDWDIHHGNGIQHVFYKDPRVLYISIHRYDNAKFFPFSKDGSIKMKGEGQGLGYNVNIAWEKGLMGDAEYISAFHRVILPIACEYNPELVLISAGFDACKGDPLGCYKVMPETFGHFIQMLKPLAGGKIIVALEGGYNVNSVGYSFTMCAKALLNDPLPRLSSNVNNIHPAAVKLLDDVVKIHSDKWSLLLKDVKFVNNLDKN